MRKKISILFGKWHILGKQILVALLVAILAIGLSLSLVQSVYASTLFESYNTGDNTQTGIYGNYWFAQSFTPSEAHTITSIKLLLYRGGSPGTITVSIKATDGSGHPTGADLCSGSTNGNTLATSYPYEWREITLGAGYSLSKTVKYGIVIRALDGDGSNLIYWRFDNSSPTYAGGCYEVSSNSGSSWYGVSGYDFMFEEYGDIILTAPDITTNAASNIAGTTARLNSTVVDDGGEACEVRWGWDDDSRPAATSTDDYEFHTSFAGSYTTGQKPYLDISDLTPSDPDPVVYYFRVEIQNSEDTDLGGELNFTTESSVGDPSDFRAYPSATSVSLAWTKGVGATNSIVRVKSDTYPTSYTDGALVYQGVSVSYTHSGLSRGMTYYYAVWGESGGIYSSGSAQVMVTTSAAETGGDEIGAPSTPLRWLTGTDYTNLSNLPVIYDTGNAIADSLDIPRGTVWFLAFMGFGILCAFIGYSLSKGSVMTALITLLVAYAFGYAVEQIPLVIPALLAIVLGAIFFTKRREAV